MLSKKFMFLALVASLVMALSFAIACGDDDDDDDDDDTEGDDDADDDADDYTAVGDCDTLEVYEAMGWLFEDCYELEDGDGNVMDADSVCENAGASMIGCYTDCYDAADECGGDPDPLFDCLDLCV
jgi:hypothetical protein